MLRLRNGGKYVQAYSGPDRRLRIIKEGFATWHRFSKGNGCKFNSLADTTVVSEPFTADRKWKILYGDGEKYKFVELNNYSEAVREFQAAINLATMDSGLFPSKFILMSSEQVLSITDLASYAKAVRLAAAEQPKAFSGRQ
jgi:hypothetical protein